MCQSSSPVLSSWARLAFFNTESSAWLFQFATNTLEVDCHNPMPRHDQSIPTTWTPHDYYRQQLHLLHTLSSMLSLTFLWIVDYCCYCLRFQTRRTGSILVIQWPIVWIVVMTPSWLELDLESRVPPQIFDNPSTCVFVSSSLTTTTMMPLRWSTSCCSREHST